MFVMLVLLNGNKYQYEGERHQKCPRDTMQCCGIGLSGEGGPKWKFTPIDINSLFQMIFIAISVGTSTNRKQRFNETIKKSMIHSK